MPRVNLPPGCAGFADGDAKWLANKPGGFVNLDETDPKDAMALRKLRNQDYASAGLVDAGPEKAFIVDKRRNGRWCVNCLRMWQGWTKECKKCGEPTIPESEINWPQAPVNKNGFIIL